jgi:hypothetical protein
MHAATTDALLWKDAFNTVHACNRTNLRQAFYLVSTKCGRNVPPNAYWSAQAHSAVNCPECQHREGLRGAE